MTSNPERYGCEGVAHLADKRSAIDRLHRQGVRYTWTERRGADIVFLHRVLRSIRMACIEVEHRRRRHLLYNILRDYKRHARQVLVLVPNPAIKRSVETLLAEHLPREFWHSTSVATMAEFSANDLETVLTRTLVQKEDRYRE